MPVYVYKNLTTGATFEIEQRIVEDALTIDPTTGDPVKRLIQPVGIAFKGSGFYVTDSRKSSRAAPKADAPKGDAAKSNAATGDAPKSDAPKSDAPPPSKAAAKPASGSSSTAGD
ncbi:MAG: FmdB family transcriptional regulator [Trueperaceae bacterium]